MEYSETQILVILDILNVYYAQDISANPIRNIDIDYYLIIL